MIKIKSQKIIPNIPAESSKASFVLSSHDLSEHAQDWNFFAVFDFEGSDSINTQVAVNIVTDVFSHTLILDEEQATLQILEKSVKESKEALQKMQTGLVFNAVVAVVKDEYIYISIYGNSKALYLDGTQIVHMDTEKEGNYASATQKVEDGRVMVLCTSEFFGKFPPKSLVSLAKPILAQDLDELSSAVILKVEKEAVPDPEISETPVTVKPLVAGRKESLSYQSTKSNKVERKFSKYLPILLLGIGVVVAGYFLVRKFVLKPETSPQSAVQSSTFQDKVPQTTASEDKKVESPEVQGELTKRLDEANKVKRVSAQVFYDVSITDAKTAPTELALGENYIAVCDKTQGKIYISTKSVTKFEELPQLFPGVRNLLFDGDTLIFSDNEGVKFYSVSTKSVNKSYLLADATYPTIGPSSEYLGFTYALSGNKLAKFSKVGNKLSGALWLEKPEFANGVSMDIDGSIYVLFSNGNLEKYSAGVKDDFSIVGLDKPIQKPLKVVTNADYKQIYVGDGEEGRIIAFDTDGVLDFQIKPQLGSEWLNLKSFDISANEKTFYVLSGTKVYEFSLM